MPVIGRTAATQSLSLAAGHGMWGLILAPVTARLICDQVLDGDEHDLDPWLTPDRFAPRGTSLTGRGHSALTSV